MSDAHAQITELGDGFNLAFITQTKERTREKASPISKKEEAKTNLEANLNIMKMV